MNIEKQKALLEKISNEVAKKHFVGEKLVTGHRKAFYTEAALEFAKQMCELQKIKCSENVYGEKNLEI